MNLHDYQSVVERRKDIIVKLSQNMPTRGTGGPWPEEWIALFDRWASSGCPRLDRPTAVTYTLVDDDGDILLIAEGNAPDEGDLWFDRNNENESPREYTLVRRPDTGGAKPFRVQEKMPERTTSVVVYDGDGKHEVKI